jgi:hypothetical protein
VGELAATKWAVAWQVVGLAAIYRSPRTLSIGARYLCAVIPAYLGLLTLSYVFSIWPSYVEHVGASLPRLVFQITPTAVFFAAVRLSDLGRVGARVRADAQRRVARRRARLQPARSVHSVQDRYR